MNQNQSNNFSFYVEMFDAEFSRITGDVSECRGDILSPVEPSNDLQIQKILEITNKASYERYMYNATPEVILANLILQILAIINGEEVSTTSLSSAGNQVFQALSQSKKFNLDEACEGFEFYENNPLRAQAEKAIARLRKKR